MSEQNNKKYILFFSEYCDYCKELLSEIRQFQLEAIFNFFNVDVQRQQLPNFVSEVPCVFLPEFNHVLSGEEVFGLLNHMKKELGLIPNENNAPNQNSNMPQQMPPQQQMPQQQMQQQQMPQQQMPPQQKMQGMQPHPSEMQQIKPNLEGPPPRMIPQNNSPSNNNAPSQNSGPQNNEPGELEGYNICEMGMCSDSYSYIEDDKMIQHNFELITDSNQQSGNQMALQPAQNSDPRKGSMKEQKISDSKYQEYLRNRNESGPKPVERH
jgi:hypothetical protein